LSYSPSHSLRLTTSAGLILTHRARLGQNQCVQPATVQLTAYIFVLYIVNKRVICNATKMCRHSAILT